MAKEDVKLLGSWASPFVMRPRIALNIKSVKYEFMPETFGIKSQLLLESNPVYKKIPVLIHAKKPVCESMIIVQYIDDTWSSAPSILPSHPYDRALARFWAAYIDDKFHPLLRGLMNPKDEEAKKALIDQVKEALGLLEEAFVNLSKGKAFFGGDQIGYLDIALGSHLGWLRVTETKFIGLKLIDEYNTPGLAKWADKFCSDDAVKDLMPNPDKLAEFAEVIKAKMREMHSK